jgi:hypothetical protein
MLKTLNSLTEEQCNDSKAKCARQQTEEYHKFKGPPEFS